MAAWPCDFPDNIFNPPKGVVDAILPLLTTHLKPLGHTINSKSSLYDLGDSRVVKAGPSVTVYEAQAMLFVRSHFNIPIPEVFIVFGHRGCIRIVMELVDGVALREAVDHDERGNPTVDRGMLADEVLNIVLHPKKIVAELPGLGRRFPLKDPFFGAFPSGLFKNCYTFTSHATEPFKSVDQFYRYFLECLRTKYACRRTSIFKRSGVSPQNTLPS